MKQPVKAATGPVGPPPWRTLGSGQGDSLQTLFQLLQLFRRQDTQILDFKCVEFIEEMLYGPFRKRPLGR